MKYFILLLVLGSCMKKSGPDEILQNYINDRFSKELEKEDFKDYFAGELLEELEGLDAKVIGDLNEVQKAKKKRLAIDFKRCDDDKCFITYTLSYDSTANAADSETKVVVKVKKIAELRRLENEWRIFGITDIKTFYDYESIN